MANFVWSLPTLERKLDDGFVFTAHWRCTATDGEFSATSYGTAGFTQDPESDSFVPYDQLTEEQVLVLFDTIQLRMRNLKIFMETQTAKSLLTW
jgi:hypothetical protein